MIRDMKVHLRAAARIVVDQTGAPVLDPGRTATKSGDFWAVLSDDRGQGGADSPIVLFYDAPGREQEHPLRILAGYRGRFPQGGACQSCNALTETPRENGPWQRVNGRTHVRRGFVKRFGNEGSPIAKETLHRLAVLCVIEKTVRGQDPAVCLAARRAPSAPIAAALKPRLEARLSRIPGNSRRAEDIRDTLAPWRGLIRVLEDGTLELDTNPVETQIRPIALTRKNAHFAGNRTGAGTWAMHVALPATCKLANVNPVDDRADPLRAILDGHSNSRIEDFMPRRYAQPSSLAKCGRPPLLLSSMVSGLCAIRGDPVSYLPSDEFLAVARRDGVHQSGDPEMGE
ncbi:MAG: transposase [Pseudomonadota bacterium]